MEKKEHCYYCKNYMATSISHSHMPKLVALLYIIPLAFSTAKAQSNVTRGSSLYPTGATTSWLSPSGLYAFGFYPQTKGYAVGIYIAAVPEKTVVWTASRDTLPLSNNVILRFTSDGRLIVEQTQGQQINVSDVVGAAFASMEDSGNFVLYDSTGTTILWQSKDHPTDTLLVGQPLLTDQRLFSSVSETDQSIGVFTLNMQLDGNLVLYPNRGTARDHPYWSTDTATAGPNVTLNLDSSGNLYMLQSSTTLIKNLTQGGYPTQDALYLMKLDYDGLFRLYYHNLSSMGQNGSVKWAVSSNRCIAKGLCGINGYCLLVNDSDECRCLPGFEFVNLERWSLGCQRKDTLESCGVPDEGNTIQMRNLNNALWEDSAYAFPKAQTQEECSSACLNDCNCEAALFTQQECMLQTLPLRYVEVNDSYPNVGFIKVQNAKPQPYTSKPRSYLGVILASTIGGVLFLLWVTCFLIYIIRKRRRDNQMKLESIGEVLGKPIRFYYEELKTATKNFYKKLGEGAFGTVYEGTLEDGTKIAVKRFEGRGHVNKSFLAEVQSIGSIHHVNLVTLIGFCAWKSQRFLVYEFMSKGSLDRWIYHGDRGHKLEWKCIKKIILDVAKGLAYLHEECWKKIIHLDIKPQNILLDNKFNAKLSDFGLSKLIDKNQSQVMTNTMKGTPGYLAPEWRNSIITEKVDVYSFGIVLLEMLCGRKIIDKSLPEENWYLLDVFQKCWEQGMLLDRVDSMLMDMVDNSEDMQTHSSEVVKMMKVASWCLQTNVTRRPSMSSVVKVLEGDMDVESNLEYNFTNEEPQNTAVEHGMHITQLVASVLSGPR